MSEEAVDKTLGLKYERWSSPKSHISLYIRDPELFLEFKYLVRNVWGRSIGAVIEEMIAERVQVWKARGNLFSIDDLRREFLRLDLEWKSFRRRVSHIELFKEYYKKLGGDPIKFSNSKETLDKMLRDLDKIVVPRTVCPVCQATAEKDHLSREWVLFEEYLSIRRRHQIASEKILELRRAQLLDNNEPQVPESPAEPGVQQTEDDDRPEFSARSEVDLV